MGAWEAATGTGSIRKPLPASVIAWTCATFTGKTCLSQGGASLCAGRELEGRQALSGAQ
jgi:hypothetical protein